METVKGQMPTELDVLTVFAKAVFEAYPDFGLTKRELNQRGDFGDVEMEFVYSSLANKKYLSQIRITQKLQKMLATHFTRVNGFLESQKKV